MIVLEKEHSEEILLQASLLWRKISYAEFGFDLVLYTLMLNALLNDKI
jgi:hypothetical protein